MEGDGQRRRHNQQLNYPQSYDNTPQVGAVTASNIRNARGPTLGAPADRITHAQYLPTHTSTTTSSELGSAIAQDIRGYGYPHNQQFTAHQSPGTAFTYQTGYPQHPQRAQPSPQYPQQSMYTFPQQPQLQHQAPYETPPPYQQRQTTAVEVLTNQFGGHQYYNTGETPAPSASVPYQTPTFQPTASYCPAEDLGRSTLASGYHVVEPHFSQTSASEASSQQQQQQQQQQEQSIPAADATYQQLLRQTNTLATQSRLVEARQSLLQTSSWLLNNIESLSKLPTIPVADSRANSFEASIATRQMTEPDIVNDSNSGRTSISPGLHSYNVNSRTRREYEQQEASYRVVQVS